MVEYDTMYRVAVLAFDGVFASALTGVVDLFNLTGVTWNRIHDQPLDRQFEVRVVSRGGNPVRCTNGIRMAVDCSLEQLDQADLVIVPTIGRQAGNRAGPGAGRPALAALSASRGSGPGQQLHRGFPAGRSRPTGRQDRHHPPGASASSFAITIRR